MACHRKKQFLLFTLESVICSLICSIELRSAVRRPIIMEFLFCLFCKMKLKMFRVENHVISNSICNLEKKIDLVLLASLPTGRVLCLSEERRMKKQQKMESEYANAINTLNTNSIVWSTQRLCKNLNCFCLHLKTSALFYLIHCD